jgi:hypothetical protein
MDVVAFPTSSALFSILAPKGLLGCEGGCPNEGVTVEAWPKAGVDIDSGAVDMVGCPKPEDVMVGCEKGPGSVGFPNGLDCVV